MHRPQTQTATAEAATTTTPGNSCTGPLQTAATFLPQRSMSTDGAVIDLLWRQTCTALSRYAAPFIMLTQTKVWQSHGVHMPAYYAYA